MRFTFFVFLFRRRFFFDRSVIVNFRLYWLKVAFVFGVVVLRVGFIVKRGRFSV